MSGGIVGAIDAFDKDSYTNNYLYYCYNIGNVKSTKEPAGIAGYLNCYDIDYTYGVKGKPSNNNLWYNVGAFRHATNQTVLEKADLISTIKQYFGSNFKDDKDNINEGYPILSWQ